MYKNLLQHTDQSKKKIKRHTPETRKMKTQTKMRKFISLTYAPGVLSSTHEESASLAGEDETIQLQQHKSKRETTMTSS